MWHWLWCRLAMLDFRGRIRRCQEERFGCDCRSAYGVMPYLCSLCRRFCTWNNQLHMHHLAKDAKKLMFCSDLMYIVWDQENIFLPAPPCSSADWPICSPPRIWLSDPRLSQARIRHWILVLQAFRSSARVESFLFYYINRVPVVFVYFKILGDATQLRWTFHWFQWMESVTCSEPYATKG